jgi:hypothetical protein
LAGIHCKERLQQWVEERMAYFWEAWLDLPAEAAAARAVTAVAARYLFAPH